jgi:hypothetical protein
MKFASKKQTRYISGGNKLDSKIGDKEISCKISEEKLTVSSRARGHCQAYRNQPIDKQLVRGTEHA